MKTISLSIAVLVALVVGGSGATAAGDYAPGDRFESTWARTDKPVADGQVSRTWIWGPGANTAPMTEEYAESPGGQRDVQYFDKSRMEINNPDADPNADWYVTNGLLVVELITGQMQVGDNSFVEHEPADVNVAGDADDQTTATYASMAGLLDAEPAAADAAITSRLDRDGTVAQEPALGDYGVTAAYLAAETNHRVASPFWNFMNSTGIIYEGGEFTEDALFNNPFYATGFPITEAYWVTATVAGEAQDVLTQCFERRCLTYTPGNPEGFQVEFGNVGQHYYTWRYGNTPPVDEVQPCNAADLNATVAWQGATGSRIGDISLTNDGSEPCKLSGRPQVEILDGETVLPVQQIDGPDRNNSEATGSPDIIIQPGQTAMVSISWDNYCGTTSGGSLIPRLTLPGEQGSLTATTVNSPDLTGPPPCLGEGEDSTVAVTTFFLNNEHANLLRSYFEAINTQDYEAAYAVLGPELQAQQSYDDFVAGFATTERDDVAVAEVTPAGDGDASVVIHLAALQTDGTVQHFAGTYDVTPVDGVLRITEADIQPA